MDLKLRRAIPDRIGWSGSRLHLADKVLRAREERVLHQDAADDDHRVRSQNIDGMRRRQHIDVEGADHRVVVIRQYAIKSHLVFDPFDAALPVVYGRFSVRDHPCQREAELGAGLQGLLDQDEHGILVEASGLEIGFLRQRDFELAAFRRLLDVDAGVAQPIEVILPVLGREDMKRTLAAVDAVADERQQRLVFLHR